MPDGYTMKWADNDTFSVSKAVERAQTHRLLVEASRAVVPSMAGQWALAFPSVPGVYGVCVDREIEKLKRKISQDLLAALSELHDRPSWG